jgi:PKD repeat protein
VGIAVTCTLTPAAASAGSPLQAAAIEWGDGTGVQNLGPVTGATTVSHVFTSPGTYTATARVFDVNGQKGTGTASLVVNRVLPTITLTVPATGTAGVPVAMSIAPPPLTTTSQPIVGVNIDFGDGTSRSFGAITGTTGFTHTYATDGGYTVTATVTDASGQRGSSSAAIVVGRATAPSVTLTHTSAPANAGVVESFTVAATAGAGGLAIASIRVTLQDGTVIYSGGGGSFVYTFSSAGTAVLTATATDAAGNTGTTQLIVIVS